MKRKLTFLAACILTTTVYAQSGFYLSPSIGAGTGSQSPFSSTPHYGQVLSKTAQIGIGYSYGRWRFQSGIQYFQSGFSFTNRPPDVIGIPGSEGYRLTLNHIGIPLQVGYAIPLSSRLSLVPHAGFVAAFAFSGSSEIKNDVERYKGSLPGSSIDQYGRFSLWGQAGLQLEYKINDKISLSGGPSMQYMLIGSGNGYEKNFYNLHFNLGAKINLCDGAKKREQK